MSVLAKSETRLTRMNFDSVSLPGPFHDLLIQA